MEVITIGLSPNIESDDVTQALKIFFMPWRWYGQDARNATVEWFKKQYSSRVTLFSSGRSALTGLLMACGIGDGDEVILQAFTCMVVPNAIRFTGATPVYVDIDDTANIDPTHIERGITNRTKAIIVQHTFGTPADMDLIIHIAHKHHILVIEDCAHALGATYKGKKAGTIGDGAIFSFGRDKIISSVFGGAATVKNREIDRKLQEIEQKLSYPSFFWIVQQLCHPIASSVILPLYRSGIGKLFLVMLQKLHILSFPVSKTELSGNKPKNYMMRYPNALASLLMRQLHKLDVYTKNRQMISSYYEKELTAMHIPILATREQSARLRFGMITEKQHQLLAVAKQHHILLGNWYHNVVDPTGYIYGLCPKAEELAKKIVNLPTRISLKQAEIIILVLRTL
jgi:dTDP-4-amino-4,6-dideoxygalactose transaminase